MNKAVCTSDQQLTEAWQALQSVPSYVERDNSSEWAITSAEHNQRFPNQAFCFDCSQWVSEDHDCKKGAA